jgi:hypothetical protein
VPIIILFWFKSEKEQTFLISDFSWKKMPILTIFFPSDGSYAVIPSRSRAIEYVDQKRVLVTYPFGTFPGNIIGVSGKYSNG